MTNREFYLTILDMIARYEGAALALNDFLVRLFMLSCRLAERDSIAAEDLLQMLESAFRDMPEFTRSPPEEARASGFDAWDVELASQIDELKEMSKSNAHDDSQLSFSDWTSHRGGVWYNFAIESYLEAAAAGTFGGWEPGDPCSRALVDGMVAVQTEESVQFEPAEDIERPIYNIPALTWGVLVEFLWNGQGYE